jgi:multidrug resistance protein MdtO
MAPPVASRSGGIFAWLKDQLAPRSGRAAFAVKLAIICAITALATAIYRTPEPALAAYLAFMVNARDRATSFLLEVVLTFLVAVLIGIVLVTAIFVIDYPALRVCAIAALSFGFLFLASASKLKPLAANFALVVGYGLDKLGQLQVGEAATRELLYAWLFVAMPALVSIVYNTVLGQHPRRLATRELARRLRLCAALLTKPGPDVREELRRSLADGGAEIRQWLNLAKLELGLKRADIARLNQAASSTLEIIAALDVLDCCAPPPVPVCEALAATLEQMAAVLDEGGYPAEIDLELPDWCGLRLCREAVAAVQRAIVGFSGSSSPDAKPQAKVRAGFFAPDAFSNPVHLQYAVKITTAAMGCYLLYSLLNWPGIHTCFLTCYIVGLGTVAESVEKLTLRIAGALVGASAGLAALLFVMPHLVSVGGLMIVIFLGALGAGYVAAGSPRISYVGFQMAFAFFLCTLQGAAPGFDMKTIRDRLIGIVIGNVAVYLVSTRLWPVSVTDRIDRTVAGSLRALGAAMGAPAHTRRPEAASAVYAGLEQVGADLELAGYEPRPMRGQPSWLQARRTAIEDIAAIQTAVLTVGKLDRAPQLSARLESLAKHLERQAVATPAFAEEARPVRSVGDLIDQKMRRLEAALADPAGGEIHATA